MKRNKFSLSHYKLLTADMGYLLPITWYEALPGDTIQHQTSALVRISPLLAPVMHPCRVRIHHWFVPYRLIWEDWEDFITGGDDGLNSSVPPYVSSAAPVESTLRDYLGVPPDSYSPNITYSALPFRAYNLIWNENYRDQDLVTEQTIDLTDGQDTTTNFDLLSCAWEKDYFTTSRDSESKGDTISIPLTGDAPVYGIGKVDQTFPMSSQAVYETDGSGSTTYADSAAINYGAGANNRFYVEEDPNNAGYPGIFADTSAISGVDINDLRLSFALQKYQEARQKYGNRYVEYLRYLGVRSSDARLQRPEYLGGGTQTIQFSEVLDHTGAGTLGDMGGHGISAMRTRKVRRFFEEHGIVMSLMSVIPKTIYSQGLHRHFSRSTKEEWYQRELEGIGDQEVRNDEVYADSADRDGVFGYQARYDEYRSLPSSIAGEFRSTLNHWHLARIFASEPSLNSSFIQCAPTKRVLASSGTDAMYIMANHSIQARRMIGRSK